MKRKDLIRRAERMGCKFLREGRKHTLYIHAKKGLTVSIPRHREINEDAARSILKRLEGSK